MSGLAALLEVLLFFGVVLAWAAWQVWQYRRWKRDKQGRDSKK